MAGPNRLNYSDRSPEDDEGFDPELEAEFEDALLDLDDDMIADILQAEFGDAPAESIDLNVEEDDDDALDDVIKDALDIAKPLDAVAFNDDAVDAAVLDMEAEEDDLLDDLSELEEDDYIDIELDDEELVDSGYDIDDDDEEIYDLYDDDDDDYDDDIDEDMVYYDDYDY